MKQANKMDLCDAGVYARKNGINARIITCDGELIPSTCHLNHGSRCMVEINGKLYGGMQNGGKVDTLHVIDEPGIFGARGIRPNAAGAYLLALVNAKNAVTEPAKAETAQPANKVTAKSSKSVKSAKTA